MAGLKQEMKALVEEAKRDHDLDRIIPSKAFKTRMEKRVKRNKLGDDHGLTWEDDDGEYASHIWAWKKPRVDTFPYHACALRLIVLTQLSSCSAERVFSCLTLIKEICGHKLLEDMMNLCLMMQCNGDICELLSSLRL